MNSGGNKVWLVVELMIGLRALLLMGLWAWLVMGLELVHPFQFVDHISRTLSQYNYNNSLFVSTSSITMDIPCIMSIGHCIVYIV